MGKPYLSGTNVLVFNKPGGRPADVLANLDKAIMFLEKASSMEQVLSMKSAVKAVEIEAHRTKAIIAEKKAIDFRVRADVTLGKMLANMKEQGTRATGHENLPRSTSGSTPAEKPTLADMNLTRNEASRVQKLAKLPEEKINEVIEKEQEKATVKIKRPRKKKVDPATCIHSFTVCALCGHKLTLEEGIEAGEATKRAFRKKEK